MRKFLYLFIVVLAALAACTSGRPAADSFIRVNEKGQFIRNGKPYYFVGTNFWYGAILASTGQGGNRERLHKELDQLKSIGLTNLRVLVGADGAYEDSSKVRPVLQVEPGVYNDTILDGLDYFLNELRKRDMTVVLYLNNSWGWSGGYASYLKWAGYEGRVGRNGKQYPPSAHLYATADKAHALFANHVDFIIKRTNRYTGVKYIDDPTIMSWQIGNEPRAFSQEGKQPFAKWMSEVSAQIRSLDPNHMISTGSEGTMGCEGDMNLFEQIHADPNISYCNIHIWPFNWRWINVNTITEDLPVAKENTKKYIDDHMEIAMKYGKPIVLEEFGYPRDGFQFSKSSTTKSRDEYYAYVFDLIRQARENGGLFAGCNFWAWGGFAEQSPDHIFWQEWDDYMGDPPQEQQGLYSIFATDSTVEIIKKETDKLK